jgi:F0F1-type ATP synthase assembly protein I
MPDDPLHPKETKRPPSNNSAQFAIWEHVYGGTQLAVSVLLGFYVGYRLDRWSGWSPWLTLAGSAIGVGIGLYGFLVPFLQRASKK